MSMLWNGYLSHANSQATESHPIDVPDEMILEQTKGNVVSHTVNSDAAAEPESVLTVADHQDVSGEAPADIKQGDDPTEHVPDSVGLTAQSETMIEANPSNQPRMP